MNFNDQQFLLGQTGFENVIDIFSGGGDGTKPLATVNHTVEKKTIQRRDFLKILVFGTAIAGGLRLIPRTSASETGGSSPYTSMKT